MKESMGVLRFLMLVGVMGSVALGDMYLHIPRGSNNRLDEANRDRANGNRLFDSQNNNRGGYNVGSNVFIETSDLEISWTNQHACGGNPKTPGCEIVIQMMCDKFSRDGTTTRTIPDNEEADLDYEYGRHESYHYYQTCKHTERNKGLFTASQNLQGDSMRFTRQNPGGTRRGYECPEERDYYPHWLPSPWMDIAILTNNLSRCDYYQEESQNVKARYYCSWTPPEGWVNDTVDDEEEDGDSEDGETADDDARRAARQQGNRLAPITEANCTAAGGFWTRVDPFGLPPPLCLPGIWTRDNHLGNTIGGYPPTLLHNIIEFSKNVNFTRLGGRLANFSNTECWLRARYNISTAETPWELDSRFNDQDGEALGLSVELGYTANFENNPDVDFGLGVEFQLAINTAQYGRTFQDRSHRMAIVPKDEELAERTIKNLMVQGKRGNIVQVFPGVEYDFVPNRMTVTVQDYIHFHWTGSNTNPNNNDGQGQNGSDRSNIAPLRLNDLGRSYPEWVNNTEMFDADYYYLYVYALCATGGFGGELSELDDLPPNCDPFASLQDQTIGLFRPRTPGNYSYMCTRNNNFSNRGQKAVLFVEDADDIEEEDSAEVGYIVGGIASGVIVSLLVAFAIISMGKNMAASSAAAANKAV